MEQKFSGFNEIKESDKSVKHEMGSIEIYCLLTVCLVGTVVTSRSISQEVAGSSPFTVVKNIFVTEFAEFIENI